MSSEAKGQLVIFTCDFCGADYSAAGSFKDAWEAAKEDGWRCFKDEDGDWVHKCDECMSG